MQFTAHRGRTFAKAVRCGEDSKDACELPRFYAGQPGEFVDVHAFRPAEQVVGDASVDHRPYARDVDVLYGGLVGPHKNWGGRSVRRKLSVETSDATFLLPEAAKTHVVHVTLWCSDSSAELRAGSFDGLHSRS